MPPDLAATVQASCNDCLRQSEEAPYHFLGVRCQHCGSFNTNFNAPSLHSAAAPAGEEVDHTSRGRAEEGGFQGTAEDEDAGEAAADEEPEEDEIEGLEDLFDHKN